MPIKFSRTQTWPEGISSALMLCSHSADESCHQFTVTWLLYTSTSFMLSSHWTKTCFKAIKHPVADTTTWEENTPLLQSFAVCPDPPSAINQKPTAQNWPACLWKTQVLSLSKSHRVRRLKICALDFGLCATTVGVETGPTCAIQRKWNPAEYTVCKQRLIK